MGRMQTELHTGIGLALALVRHTEKTALLKDASQQFEQLFGLGKSWVLELDVSGRELHCTSAGEEFGFETHDCSHPFAQVLRENKSVLLTRAVSLRLDHSGFQRLLEVSGHPEHLWIEPLRRADGRILGVVMIGGSPSDLPHQTEQPLFRDLVSLLSHQWAHLLTHHDQTWDRRMLSHSLASLQDHRQQQTRIEALAQTLVGNSEIMQQLRHQIVTAASSQLTVLIQGETGCGKDLVARGVHECSTRRNGPYVVVNCAAIPDSLLESELFGHTRGAFSGADRAREGMLAEADGGTLFLDEIGDMALSLQSKLLRVLETRSFRPLGARKEQHSDFRLLAATHQPLRDCIAESRFRQDLFYRLNQFPLIVAPLRDRPSDLEDLCRHFIREFAGREGGGPMGISSPALQRLSRHAFPGNVRELRNVIELACLQTPAADDIQPESLHLGSPVENPAISVKAVPMPSWLQGLPEAGSIDDLPRAAREFEAAVIRERLERFHGNRALAAESLGLPKRTLAYKCQKFNLTEAG